MIEESVMSTKKALFVVASIVFLSVLLFAVPLHQKDAPATSDNALILKSDRELSSLADDKNNNGSPDWRDLAISSLGTTTKSALANVVVDNETKKRLLDENNITASFSKKLYIASEYAKSQGGLTQEEERRIMESIISEEGAKIVPKQYSSSDLTVAKNESASSLHVYGNSLGTLLAQAKYAKLTEGDLDILNAYTTTKDASVLSAFVIKKNKLGSIIRELLMLPIPPSAVPYHTIMLNNLSLYYTMLDNFSQADTDPLRSNISIATYYDTMTSLSSSFFSVARYFASQNVTFTKDEAGYAIISVYTK